MLNPVTSEYQTFCQYCDKKLANNFADWHKLHPDKAFEDFKLLFGVEEEQPVPKKRASRFVSKDGKGKRRILWRALIGFVVITGLVTFAGRKAADFVESVFYQKSTPGYYLTKTWDTVSYGQNGLTMATPVTLKQVDMGFPQQLIDLTDEIMSFKTAEDLPVQVFVDVVKYKPRLPMNLQNAADGAVNEIKSRPDVSDFTYTENHTKISDIPAILQTGTYAYAQDTKIRFRDLFILKDHIMWHVAILYRDGDNTAGTVADRMIQSIKVRH
jgi:hypothetical protein